ncbi:endonuclease/exonuclease/phosphatase family protein [Zunongwangia sp. HGR-M22]|uniref:endonuclease/exonuclease/phosphatase family protein n=1 Tax=Zunongwangia sp. HGR-M22 TaxID=3015168 RepID=UPI0022DD5663|nr:endonuclease/exonuclease/phosphatase family protein [Zunongwangia sp. HGR-M22]WBL26712.1 endonuclease/exonuclease/phosphatase family protein [Zunongwangia sp. HGR-M22]
MKFVSKLLACILLVYSCHDSSPDEINEDGNLSDMNTEIKVLSYNIHHSNPPSQSDIINLNAIADVLKQSKADVVGLQEVDVYTERSGKQLHMARSLAELAGFTYWYFSKSIDFQGGAYGTAILSKFPISDTLTLALPNPENAEPRSLSLATVHLNDSLKLRFGNTHLDYTNETNNLDQVKAIRNHLSQNDISTILTGDFNVVPSSASMEFIFEEFTSTCKNQCAFTSPSNSPSKTIDYILYAGKGLRSINHQVLLEPFPSDHLPVLSRLLFY